MMLWKIGISCADDVDETMVYKLQYKYTQGDSPGVLPSFLIYSNSIFWNSEQSVKYIYYIIIVTRFG